LKKTEEFFMRQRHEDARKNALSGEILSPFHIPSGETLSPFHIPRELVPHDSGANKFFVIY
jgi:hypothetical protein